MAYNVKRPLSPSERRAREAKRTLFKAIVLAVVVVVAGIGAYIIARRSNPGLSEEDLCRIGVPPIEEVVVLLDATDAWNAVQRTVLAQEFRTLQGDIPRFARVSLYTLEHDAEAMPPAALQLCNPGTASDIAEVPILGARGVGLIANPQMIEQRWREGFNEKLDSIFGAQVRSSGASQSPILETIRSSAINVFGPMSNTEGGTRKLYIFSDMLQHTERYSHYTDPDWTVEDARRLADLSMTGTVALDGAQVHLFLLDRDVVGRGSGNSRSALVEFWDAYFAEQGATVVRVRRIEG